MKAFIFLLAYSVSQLSYASIPNPEKEVQYCQSGKEFITTFEYLRDSSDMAGSGDNALSVATQVAMGCNGAAKRFISILNFLKKVEIPVSETLEISVDFARREDVHVEAFKQIFKKTYAEDGFDLDLKNSLTIARALSVEFKGDIRRAMIDFEKVTQFCSNPEGVQLLKGECAQLAKRVALSGKETGPMVSEEFLKTYQYLKNTVNVTVQDSLRISEGLMKVDPKAFENFKMVYEYAMSEKGLKSKRVSAVMLAKKIAEASIAEAKSSNAK